MRLIDADALKEEVNKKKIVGRFNTIMLIDNAPTVERPKYILKGKNLTCEDKKRFQEEWNKSAGGLLVISDDCEIIPTERPQGKWIEKKNENLGKCLKHLIECSVCGSAFCYEDLLRRSYCPNCGARMTH